MDGNGNQPRFEPRPFWSGVSAFIVPSSQWPCSSMAALPLPIMPAELVAPCCAGVARNPSWNGFASSSCFVSVPAFVQHAFVKSRLTAAFCSVALLHRRTAR